MIQEITYYHLNQLKTMVDTLTDEEYRLPLPILDGSSIGMHVRHILEFYLCLFNSIEKGELCYDKRPRDTEMEVSRNKCLQTINLIIQRMHRNINDLPISLKSDLSLDLMKKEILLDTTYYRELLYNLEHLVHHSAIIKIGAKSLGSPKNIDESFGVALSTIRNRKQFSR
jgi:hypothetical protein